jgi:hypothetical protein
MSSSYRIYVLCLLLKGDGQGTSHILSIVHKKRIPFEKGNKQEGCAGIVYIHYLTKFGVSFIFKNDFDLY